MLLPYLVPSLILILSVYCVTGSRLSPVDVPQESLIELRPPNRTLSRRVTVNQRLYISPTTTDWYSARKACQDSGLRLVQLKSEVKKDDVFYHFIENNIMDDVWIGLSDIRSEGTWVWDDGSLFVDGTWLPDGGNDDNRDCGALRPDGTWFSSLCRPPAPSPGSCGVDVPLRYICESLV